LLGPRKHWTGNIEAKQGGTSTSYSLCKPPLSPSCGFIAFLCKKAAERSLAGGWSRCRGVGRLEVSAK
ncbi:MAG: hypothetical protein ACK53L_07495, partial [Pirellulaceae bacterium]